MLEIRNLKKTYKTAKGAEHCALKGINLKFESSGMVFILGKSGSGKSTLLNVVSGLDAPDSGEILICGRSTSTFTDSDYDSYRNTYLGFIFQEYNILNEFTVGENITLAIELQGRKASPEALEEVLKVVGLEGLKDRKPNELSGGQKQRIAIARALIKNPEIIFADEPTGNLDSANGAQLFEFLTQLAKEKLLIIVSHDRESAFRYGDRIIELADGEVAEDYIKSDDGSFVPARAIKIDKNKKSSLIRSKLPGKTAWRMALHSIGQKKIKLTVTMLLIVLAVSLFGFTKILSGYSLVDSSVASFERAGIDNVIFKQGSLGEYFNDFQRDNREVTPAAVKKINGAFPEIVTGEYFFLRWLTISMSGGNYLPGTLNGAVVTTEEGVKQLGYKLIGGFPDRDDPSIVIADFVIFMCLSKNPGLLGLKKNNLIPLLASLIFDETKVGEAEAKLFVQDMIESYLTGGKEETEALNAVLRLASGDEDIEKNLETFAVIWEKLVEAIILRSPVLEASTKLPVKGALITGFEKYVDLLQMTRVEQKQDERVVTFSYDFTNFYCVVYTSRAFIDFWYSEKVKMSNFYAVKQFRADGVSNLENINITYNSDWLAMNPDKILGQNEIIISDILFNDIFGGLTVFEPDRTEEIYLTESDNYKYTYNYTTYNDRLQLYGKAHKLKVVGVFNFYDTYRQNQDQNPDNNVNLAYEAAYMIANEKVFSEFTHMMKRCNALYMRMPDSAQQRAKVLNFICGKPSAGTGMLMYHATSVSNIIYYLDEVLFIFDTVFKYLSYLMGAFSIILLINFMSASVMNKKKDIGILRGLGARGRDIAKIFINEATIIGLSAIALSCAGMTLMTSFVNAGIRRNVMQVFKNDMVNHLSLLTLSLSPYILVIIASVVLVYLATIIPARKISKMKPVDAIKKA